MTSEKTEGKTLANHSAIYAASDLSRKLVSFLMLPIYTHYLSPEDYGFIELLTMTITIAEIIFGARLGHAIFRYYHAYESSIKKQQVLSSALIITIVASLFGLIPLLSFSGLISEKVLGNIELQPLVILFSLKILLIPIEEYAFILLRLQKKVWTFFYASILKTALQLSLNIYFVVILQQSVEGVIHSSLLSSLVIAIPSVFYLFKIAGLNPDRIICKKLIWFSLPLWGGALLTFYLELSDRFFIKEMIGVTDVGIYALSMKFSILISMLVWWPFYKAWDGYRYEVHKEDNATSKYNDIFSNLSLLLVIVGLALSLFSYEVISIMASDEFLSSYKYIPILTAGFILNAWTGYLQFSFLISDNTKFILYGQLLAAIALTASLLLLIPSIGLYGAAASFTVSALVQLIWTIYIGSKSYHMGVKLISPLTILAIASLLYLITFILPEGFLIQLFAKIGLLVTLLIIVYCSPLLTDEQKNVSKQAILKIKTLIQK